jgi:hypothetical protein
MGTSGWDDETRGSGRSSRDARPREGERLPGRSSERASYDYDRGGRARSRDDGWSDTDRSRSYSRRDERDYERGAGGSGSIGGGPGSSSGRNRRPPTRDDYDDNSGRDGRPPRDSRGGAGRMEREWSDEQHPARGQRPPQRGEAWESQQRRGPGNSGVRSNSSARGGLWEDDAEMRGRRPGRPGGSDPRARNMGNMGGGRPDMRDPRAPRRGVGARQEPEEEKKGLGCGPAILVVLLMFVVGVGGGYAAFKVTAPKINADITTPGPTTTPATTPSVPPKASPTATPKADTPHIWVASSAPYGI